MFACLSVCVQHACKCPQRPEDVGTPRTEAVDDVCPGNPPLGPLQEEQVLRIAESSIRSLTHRFCVDVLCV